jgi:hypothetical protein
VNSRKVQVVWQKRLGRTSLTSHESPQCPHFLLSECFRAQYGAPAVARVVFRHGYGNVSGLFAQVLLVDRTVLVDNEGHDSRISVFGGIGENGKPTRHLSIDDVILCATLCLVSLFGQYLEVVAVERLGLIAGVRVTGGLREVAGSCTKMTGRN